MKDTVKHLNIRALRSLMKNSTLEEVLEFNERVQVALKERQEDEELKRLEEEERAKAIEDVMKMLAESGLSVNDLKPKKAKVEKKYRYSVGGETKTWSGKGPKPAALAKLLDEGKTLEDFLMN